MKIEQIRQGDIFLIKRSDTVAIDDNAKTIPVILGHGEVTGHKHVLEVATVLNGDDLAWDLFAQNGEWRDFMHNGPPTVAVPEDTSLVHDEHKKLIATSGVWEIRRQREYTPEASRYVND